MDNETKTKVSKSSAEIASKALRILADQISSPDDVPAMCLRDAAEMIELLMEESERLRGVEAAAPTAVADEFAGHTPAPWEWSDDKWHGGYSGMSGPDGAEVMRPECSNDGDTGAAWFSDDSITEANRKLIAAAPDLLARVRALEQERNELKHQVWKLGQENEHLGDVCGQIEGWRDEAMDGRKKIAELQKDMQRLLTGAKEAETILKFAFQEGALDHETIIGLYPDPYGMLRDLQETLAALAKHATPQS